MFIDIYMFNMYSVRQKSIPKIFVTFLATAWTFDVKFYTFITYSYVYKISKDISLSSNVATLLNLLFDHVVTSDVYIMFAEQKTHQVCTVTQKKIVI